MTDWEWFALSYDSDTSTLTGMTLRNDRDTEVISWKASRYFTPAYEATIKFHGRNTSGSTPWQASYAFLGLWTNTITRSDLHWLSQNLHSLRRHPPKLNQYGYTLKPPTAVLEASSGEAVLSAGAYGSKTTVYLSQGDGVTQPIELRQRSPVTAQRTSLTGEMLNEHAAECDTNNWTIANHTYITAVTAPSTNFVYSEVAPASLTMNSFQTTVGASTAGNRVYDVSITLTAAAILTSASGPLPTVTVYLGGTQIGTIAHGASTFTATARSGAASTIYLLISTSTPGGVNATNEIGFDRVSVKPWASGDLMHSHTYAAASLVPSTTAAPYFEFSAAGSYPDADDKTNVVALASSTVATTPDLIGAFAATSAGAWRLTGKVYATTNAQAITELMFVDAAGTQLLQATNTLASFRWDTAGYIYFGAHADDDDDVHATSSVEFKP